MSIGNKTQQNWRKIFRLVMARYDELKSVQGTNSCTAFYKALASEGSRASTNPKEVRVLPSDFICDVELAAKASLSPHEYRFFKLVYLDKDPDVKRDAVFFKDMKRAVQEKLGRVFQVREIYPVHKYMKGKVID